MMMRMGNGRIGATLLASAALAACGSGQDGKNGTDGTPGTNGTNGTSGANGGNSLVLVVDEPPGSNCPAGGKKIESGLDTNHNGALDPG